MLTRPQPYEAEAVTHEAEAEAKTHETEDEAKVEVRFFGLEAETEIEAKLARLQRFEKTEKFVMVH